MTFFEEYIEDNCIPAKFVTLIGQVVVCGFNTRSLDASRDLCAIHLHLKTGGVFVKRDDSLTFLNQSVVSHVELDPNYERPLRLSGAEAEMQAFAQELQKQRKTVGFSNHASDYEEPPKPPVSREDEILSELERGATVPILQTKKSPAKSRRKVKE